MLTQTEKSAIQAEWLAVEELETVKAQRDELAAALRAIANGRADRLHCSHSDLWEVMRDIARAALARIK